MKAVIEKIAENLTLPEGPHWDSKTQTLYYVDLCQETVFKYIPSTNHHAKAPVTDRASIIIPVEDKPDQFVITNGTNVLRVSWDGSPTVKVLETIAKVDAGPDNCNTFNDGKADALGNLWSGTMSRHVDLNNFTPVTGSFYSVNTRKEVKNHFSGVWISNGLAWSIDNKYFYYVDSGSRSVDRFDFDLNSGTISNREIWFSLDKHNIPGLADGQTIDTDGNLWVAVFNGSRVIKIDGNKKDTLLDTLDIPQKLVTSVSFGGTNLDELYVTAACDSVMGVMGEKAYLNGGSMFRVKGVGAKGFPGLCVKI